MRINVKECTDHISIGKTGENIITEVVFPAYEGFSAALTYQRPGETPYPIALTRAEGGWLWTVTNTELAVPGWGWSEVVYTEGEAVKLSKTYRVVIGESLEPAGEVPSGWESYYEDIIEAGNNAQTAAGEAKASSANAEQSEVNAAGSAVVAQSYAQTASEKATDAIAYARSAASSATSAKERADLADGFAEVAQSAATEALTSATNASASASQAAASADEAEQKADAVLGLTVTAKGLPEGSAPTAERSIVGEHYNIEFGIPAGATGAKGDKGDAGFSPTATVTQDGDVTTIEVTDEQGTTSAEIDLSDYMRKEDAWSLLPTDTASGAVASFPDGADDVPMISLVANVEPVQDLHGYDSPWPAGGGKNKFNVDGFTENDLMTQYGSSWHLGNYMSTLTVEKGTITFTRTSKDIAAFLCIGKVRSGVPTTISFDAASPNALFDIDLRTAKPSDELNSERFYRYMIPSGTTRLEHTVTPEQDGFLYVEIYAAANTNGAALSNIQLEESSTATAWTPYENICPISGWTAAEVTVNGKTITHEFKDAQGNTLTVYGGGYDLVGGKLTATMGGVIYDGSENWRLAAQYNGTNFQHAFFSIANVPNLSLKPYSQSAEGLASNWAIAALVSDSTVRDEWTCRRANGSATLYVLTPTSMGAVTLEQFKARLAETPIQFVYDYNTPLEYDLTAEDLRTLYGDNTIFADCGDVSVNYRADVQRWVEKKLAE